MAWFASVPALTEDSQRCANQSLTLRWRSWGIDMRRDDICLYLNPMDRARLEEMVADRNSLRKWVWRAEIVLATADRLGTSAIMRRTGKSKPCVWRWQERYIDEGVPGLLRDKTRPSRVAPPSALKVSMQEARPFLPPSSRP